MSQQQESVVFVDGRWLKDDGLPIPPDDSVSGTPGRRPGSVRRTSHVDVMWEDGPMGPMFLSGASRDLRTGAGGEPDVVGAVRFALDVSATREVLAARVTPTEPGVDELIGMSTAKGFRARTKEALGPTALRSLLDDVAVVSGISMFAWFLPTPRVPMPDFLRESLGPGEAPHQRRPDGRISCTGLRIDGFEQVNRDRGIPFPHFVRTAGVLDEVDDAHAWHDIDPIPAVCMRRRRRADLWRADDGELRIDAHFRDSTRGEDGVEYAVHEYSIEATVEAGSLTLRTIAATPHVLPFPECPLAADHVGQLVGMPLGGFRATVPENLTELESCTHLSDMLRSLADVPQLVDRL